MKRGITAATSASAGHERSEADRLLARAGWEAQRQLQVGERQAYEIAHAAGTVRLGRSLRVRPEDLSAYLQRVAVRGLAEHGI